MPIQPHRPAASADDALSQTLIDRVLARVHDAQAAFDQRAGATRRRGLSSPTSDPLAARMTRSPEQVRETRSLRRVFHDLGATYRQYRKETGAPVSPEVRAAAHRFRKELSVQSLASVAGRLDDLKILNW